MYMQSANVAGLVHEQYAALPKTGKPQAGEWTILAGIVLTSPMQPATVVALGTGTKCLTAAQIAADTAGECIHDAHAEVCARRALRAYLLAELHRLADPAGSTVLQPQKGAGGGFEMRPGVELHFYTSEPPCGDAAIFDEALDGSSIPIDPAPPPPKRARGVDAPSEQQQQKAEEVQEQEQEQEEQQQQQRQQQQQGAILVRRHRTGARPAAASALTAEEAMCGGECTLGLVRTKPGRGERTCCVSCSDKLAKWCAIGVQGALLSILLPAPIRFASITVGEPCSLGALSRAISRAIDGQPASRATAATDQDEEDGCSSASASLAANDAPRPHSASVPISGCLPRLVSTSLRFEHASTQATPLVAGAAASVAPSAAASAAVSAAAPAAAPVAALAAAPAAATPTRALPCGTLGTLRPCSNSLVWATSGMAEALNGLSGKRLGANKRVPSPKHRSAVCKAVLLQSFCELVRRLPHEQIPRLLLTASRHGAGARDQGAEARGARLLLDEGVDCGAVDGITQQAGLDAAEEQVEVTSAAESPATLLAAALAADYASLKTLAWPYQRRKERLMRVPPFIDWVRAPRSCEAFALAEM